MGGKKACCSGTPPSSLGMQGLAPNGIFTYLCPGAGMATARPQPHADRHAAHPGAFPWLCHPQHAQTSFKLMFRPVLG